MAVNPQGSVTALVGSNMVYRWDMSIMKKARKMKITAHREEREELSVEPVDEYILPGLGQESGDSGIGHSPQ